MKNPKKRKKTKTERVIQKIFEKGLTNEEKFDIITVAK